MRKKFLFAFLLISLTVFAQTASDYIIAAKQGNAEAQCNLGTCYINGWGVSKNPAEATKWWRKSAEQGYAKAQNKLGLCYHNGNGVTKNHVEAVKWFRKAAEQGYASAQFTLGICYLGGIGVSKDPTEAVKWLRKAAEQGDAEAQYFLAESYFNGWGVSQNPAEAVKWYRKAAEQGHAEAKDKMSISSDASMKSGSENGHSWVDLDLPSGTKWATCNLGANNPQDYGSYYSWGETSAKKVYDKETYKYYNACPCPTCPTCPTCYKLTKYCWRKDYEENGVDKRCMNCADFKTKLEPTDDAAYVNWGGKWKMPTNKQLDELKYHCYWVWTDNYKKTNVAGYVVYKAKRDWDAGRTGLEGELPYNLSETHIFLPAAGLRYKTDGQNILTETNENGYYWSRSMYLDIYYSEDSEEAEYWGKEGLGDYYKQVTDIQLQSDIETVAPDDALHLFFDARDATIQEGERHWGFPVRAVIEK